MKNKKKIYKKKRKEETTTNLCSILTLSTQDDVKQFNY